MKLSTFITEAVFAGAPDGRVSIDMSGTVLVPDENDAAAVAEAEQKPEFTCLAIPTDGTMETEMALHFRGLVAASLYEHYEDVPEGELGADDIANFCGFTRQCMEELVDESAAPAVQAAARSIKENLERLEMTMAALIHQLAYDGAPAGEITVRVEEREGKEVRKTAAQSESRRHKDTVRLRAHGVFEADLLSFFDRELALQPTTALAGRIVETLKQWYRECVADYERETEQAKQESLQVKCDVLKRIICVALEYVNVSRQRDRSEGA